MKPLLFLTFRSFLNGIKRSLSSPTRLLGLIFFTGYYFMWFIRPSMSGKGFGRAFPAEIAGKLDFPPLHLLNAVVFGIFALFSVLLMLGGLAQQGGFKPADVDMLFATPISPRIVLIFRIARDYLLTLIMPLFLLMVGIVPVRAGWEALFRNMPNKEFAPMVVRAGIVAWLLLSLCWVTINYAVSLHVNRSDSESDRNRRILGWAISAVVIAAASYGAYQIRQSHNLKEVLEISFSPLLRCAFFTASFATMLTMAPLDGSIVQGLLGGAALLAIVGAAVAVALRQSGWMYDQAAVKGFSNAGLKLAQRQGDVLLAVAESAKTSNRKVRKLNWLSNLRVTGPWALLWKDLFLQMRGMLWVLLTIFALGLFMTLSPLLFPDRHQRLPVGALFMMMQAATVFMCTVSLANAGYLELLRRVDLQKPLPFTPAVIVSFEVASKALLGIAVCTVASVIGLFLRPDLWQEALAAIIFAPALSVLMSATVFLVIILFPDMDDQTQRQFRAMLMMLALIILGLPPIGVFIGLAALHMPYYAAAAISAAVCLVLAWFVALVSGFQYANFNPSE